MRRRLRPVLQTLLGTCIALALLEIVVRLVMPAPLDLMRLNQVVESERGKFARYDSLLGWDGRTNVEADFQWIDTNHHVRQNRFGYRGPAYETARTDKRRLLVLGDSFVWGFGVEEDDIFTSRLERESGYAVEVINAGVSGYGTDQEYLLWREKASRWQPDDVLLVVTPYTDIVDNLFPRRYGYPKPQFVWTQAGELELTNVPVPKTSDFADDKQIEVDIEAPTGLSRLLAHSHLAKMLVNAGSRFPGIRGALESSGLMPSRLPGYDWEYPLYLAEPPEQVQQAWAITFALLDQMADDVAARGARLSVAIVPTIVQVYPELWEQFRTTHGAGKNARLDREQPNRQVNGWCQRRGVRVIDLLPALTTAGETDSYLYFPYNLHWTPDGHAIVAETLLRGMEIETSD